MIPHQPLILTTMSSKARKQYPSTAILIIIALSQLHRAISSSIMYHFTGKPIPAQPHANLNIYTGTVSISPTDCLVFEKDCSDCGDDACLPHWLLCYIMPMSSFCKASTNTSKISFHALFYQVDSSPINLKNVGILATLPNTVSPQPTALCVPNHVMMV